MYYLLMDLYQVCSYDATWGQNWPCLGGGGGWGGVGVLFTILNIGTKKETLKFFFSDVCTISSLTSTKFFHMMPRGVKTCPASVGHKFQHWNRKGKLKNSSPLKKESVEV